jgi:hypothetical protein
MKWRKMIAATIIITKGRMCVQGFGFSGGRSVSGGAKEVRGEATNRLVAV